MPAPPEAWAWRWTMGKVRHVIMGDEAAEEEARKKAETRRLAKLAKKKQEAEKEADTQPEAAETEESLVQETEKKKVVKKKREIKAKVRSKKYQEAAKLVDKTKLYPLADAVSLVKKTSITNFDGTVELHINLNPVMLDVKKGFRTGVQLPHGTGKEVKVVIADDTVIEEIQSGTINFDVLVAHPSMMPKLAKVARILGPRGLMPNPKTGTVTPEPEKRAKELSSGQVNIKTEPDNLLIHMPVGKISFDDKDIIANIRAVLAVLDKKIARISISSTMGPGVRVIVE